MQNSIHQESKFKIVKGYKMIVPQADEEKWQWKTNKKKEKKKKKKKKAIARSG